MEARAFAKVNLTLEVLGRRPDGYHEVRTVLQTIDLADRLHFSPGTEIQVECCEPGLDGAGNLVWEAAQALRVAAGCHRGVRIDLDKSIPIAMGLGGGSSDAAATLEGLNSFWELGLEDTELRSIAATLGADVPFFLAGGTAKGEGRGDVISELPAMPQRWMVLACPPVRAVEAGISMPQKTGRVYSLLSQAHYTDGSYTSGLADALVGGRFAQEHLFNVFEAVAPGYHLDYERFHGEFLEVLGGRTVHLSGTGPALYALVTDKAEGDEVLKSLKSRDLRAYCVTTMQPSHLSDNTLETQGSTGEG